MNFFMVGSFFMLFMLNAGWTSNYVIKLVGFLFFAVGTAEAEERTDAFAHLKKPAYTSSAMCALAVVCQLLLKLLSPAAMAANVISILLSAATVYMSLNLMRMVLVALDSHRELVEDVSNIVRFQQACSYDVYLLWGRPAQQANTNRVRHHPCRRYCGNSKDTCVYFPAHHALQLQQAEDRL